MGAVGAHAPFLTVSSSILSNFQGKIDTKRPKPPETAHFLASTSISPLCHGFLMPDDKCKGEYLLVGVGSVFGPAGR
eukprot:7236568-Prymnesium_polylepis.1